jgi:hypothetical protein
MISAFESENTFESSRRAERRAIDQLSAINPSASADGFQQSADPLGIPSDQYETQS